MEITYISTVKVKEYGRNPRVIPAEAVEKVAKSIKEFGWQQPIVVDEGMVILAGHTRLRAANLIGCAVVPVKVETGLTDAQKAAYRLADNRLGDIAEWDMQRLAQEVAALTDEMEDITVLGFSDDELGDLVARMEPFTPSLDPSTTSTPVTTEDVGKAETKLTGQQAEGSKQKLVETICPHCGAEYFLDLSQV